MCAPRTRRDRPRTGRSGPVTRLREGLRPARIDAALPPTGSGPAEFLEVALRVVEYDLEQPDGFLAASPRSGAMAGGPPRRGRLAVSIDDALKVSVRRATQASGSSREPA